MLNDLLMLSRLETSDTRRGKAGAHRPAAAGYPQDALALSGERQHESRWVPPASPLRGLERGAISNLVYNAVKYTQDGGQIQISWSQDEQGPPERNG